MLIRRTEIRRLGPYHSDDRDYLLGDGREHTESDLTDDPWVEVAKFIKVDRATVAECAEASDPADGYVVDPEYTIMLVYEVKEAIQV